jgi:hypothetical protein
MGRPLIHAVIPLIDNLTDILEKAAEQTSTHVIIRAGALAGLKLMNKYYEKTDESIAYRIAMRK